MTALMTEDATLLLIKDSLNKVAEGVGDRVTPETDLVAEEIVDSLDLMNFLFEVEQSLGSKLTAITEDYDDYRVASLMKVIAENR